MGVLNLHTLTRERLTRNPLAFCPRAWLMVALLFAGRARRVSQVCRFSCSFLHLCYSCDPSSEITLIRCLLQTSSVENNLLFLSTCPAVRCTVLNWCSTTELLTGYSLFINYCYCIAHCIAPSANHCRILRDYEQCQSLTSEVAHDGKGSVELLKYNVSFEEDVNAVAASSYPHTLPRIERARARKTLCLCS